MSKFRCAKKTELKNMVKWINKRPHHTGSNTSSSPLMQLCRDKPSEPVYSAGNSVSVVFKSDGGVNRGGVLMSVQAGGYF